MSSQVSDRGQITIDREIRDRLGVHPGMIAHQRIVGGLLEVIFLPAPHRKSLFGALHRDGESALVDSTDDIERAVIEAIAENG